MSTITLEVEDLTTLVSEVAADAAMAALAKFGVVIQQPKAEAPATRSAKPKAAPKVTTSKPRSTKAGRSAKPVSKAQHAKGSKLEVAFGIDANGRLSAAQQRRVRQVFSGGIVEPWNTFEFPKGTITMAMIREAVMACNASLKGANESTIRLWVVWNGPKGRITDEAAREFMKGQRKLPTS